MSTVMPISQHGQETQRSLNYGWTPERVDESRGLGGGSLEPGRRSIGLVPRWARADPFPLSHGPLDLESAIWISKVPCTCLDADIMRSHAGVPLEDFTFWPLGPWTLGPLRLAHGP